MAPSFIMQQGALISHCGISAIGWASTGGLTGENMAVRCSAAAWEAPHHCEAAQPGEHSLDCWGC